MHACIHESHFERTTNDDDDDDFCTNRQDTAIVRRKKGEIVKAIKNLLNDYWPYTRGRGSSRY